MTLTPTDLTFIAIIVLACIFMAVKDDTRAWHWLKTQWSSTVGAWFARRRLRIRVPRPDEHSPGIMVARRDVNTGSWT